ncbi:hypothetical protein AB1Y20_022047 [Prymnesium parvum]|uniref:non-specific serine/threonine protein kinase n=1 Tax=Prymnesium parvum TaxID=97485 RepID=A0AB34JG47_PRYPA
MEAYVKGKELGRGAMGTVFLATRRADGAQLAVKTSRFAELPAVEQTASLREVHLLAKLKHPHLIGYFDAFLANGELHIVMEQAAGGSLEDELKAARHAGIPIAEPRLLDLFVQVGSAVHYIHSCRVLHRDIKPANILLDSAGRPKLADFGISTTIKSHALQTGRALSKAEDTAGRENALPKPLSSGLEGTPFYLAPELFEDSLQMGNCMYSYASDVWALGVVMYELLCLERPYTGDSLPSLAYRIVRDLSQNAMRDFSRSTSTFGYSSELTQAVEAMLHKRPHERATLGELLSRAFVRRWQQDRTLASPPLVDVLEAKRKLLQLPIADVYMWGRGRTLPALREDLMGIVVVQVACGAKHCAVVSDEGVLYTWGDNDYGQCGHGDRARLSRRRPVLSVSSPVAAVACGRAHTALCTKEGRLLCCGSNERAQLALAEQCELLDAMRCLAFFSEADGGSSRAFAAVSCGEAHSLALSAGVVFGWGAADDGRLGFDADEEGVQEVWSPRCVAGLEANAIQIACGDDFSAVLDEQGVVWGFGANFNGQLGLEGDLEMVANPTELMRGMGVGCAAAQLACAADHMAVLDTRGRVWVWGGRFGTPREVKLKDGASEESCAAEGEGGRDADTGLEQGVAAMELTTWNMVACGSEMVLAVTDSGACYVWGAGAHGRLGLDDGGKDHAVPQPLPSLSTSAGVRVQAVACGCCSSSLDEGPAVIALVVPEKVDALEEQFERHFLVG